MGSPQLLIDADPIVYRVGFAAQTKAIHCVLESATGELEQVRFGSKTERNEWLEQHPGSSVTAEEEEVIPEPIANALAGVKRLLGEIIDRAGTDQTHVILSESSGKGNFRHAIAKQAPYKGNRKQPRPFHYQNIREYLTDYWGAQIVQTREADDEIAIRAKRYRAEGIPYVIATIDKDLDQIPGPHYDYAKKVSYNVSEDDARRAFWIQALSGDSTDNIPGAWKIGDKRAAAHIDAWLSLGYDDRMMFESAITVYDRQCLEYAGCPYICRPALDVALETAQLVWMQDEPCTIWAPPGVPRGKIPCEQDEY